MNGFEGASNLPAMNQGWVWRGESVRRKARGPSEKQTLPPRPLQHPRAHLDSNALNLRISRFVKNACGGHRNFFPDGLLESKQDYIAVR